MYLPYLVAHISFARCHRRGSDDRVSNDGTAISSGVEEFVQNSII
jgi:hypothetical protein